MNSYAIYRVTETIRIVLFVVAAMVAFDFYPITAILIMPPRRGFHVRVTDYRPWCSSGPTGKRELFTW